MLHGILGKQGIEVIGVNIQVAGILHVDGHLRARVAVPAVHALDNADTSHDIGAVKCLEVGFKHACHFQVPHFDLVINEIGGHPVAGMEPQAISDHARYGNLVGRRGVADHRHCALYHLALEVAPVIPLVHAAHDDAHEVLVGLEDGALVGDEADALNHLGKCTFCRNRLTHFASVDGGIVLVDAQGGIGHPEVGV